MQRLKPQLIGTPIWYNNPSDSLPKASRPILSFLSWNISPSCKTNNIETGNVALYPAKEPSNVLLRGNSFTMTSVFWNTMCGSVCSLKSILHLTQNLELSFCLTYSLPTGLAVGDDTYLFTSSEYPALFHHHQTQQGGHSRTLIKLHKPISDRYIICY